VSLPNAILRTSSAYGLVPATTAGATTVFAAPTVLCKVTVTSTGTGSGTPVQIYDNASAASGNVVAAIPANAAAGTVYEFHVPMASGITVEQVTNGPGLCVTYA
jgi:hypothetical protein